MKPLLIIALISVMLSSCAQRPEPQSLLSAREYVSQAELFKANELAPEEYLRAHDALMEAEASFRHGDLDAVLDHKSMLARTRGQIALLSAQEVKNRQRIEELNQQKNDLISRRKKTADMLRVQEELLRLKDSELNRKDQQLNELDREVAANQEKLRSLEMEHEKTRLELMKAIAEIAKIRETKRGLIVSLSNILFEFNRAELKPGSQQNLKQISRLLNEYPDRKILIEGHTDNVGSDAYNQMLSEKRADSVREFLVRSGIPQDRLRSKGYGKRYPLATNDRPEGRQQNRRVDIVIVNPNQPGSLEPEEIQG